MGLPHAIAILNYRSPALCFIFPFLTPFLCTPAVHTCCSLTPGFIFLACSSYLTPCWLKFCFRAMLFPIPVWISFTVLANRWGNLPSPSFLFTPAPFAVLLPWFPWTFRIPFPSHYRSKPTFICEFDSVSFCILRSFPPSQTFSFVSSRLIHTQKFSVTLFRTLTLPLSTVQVFDWIGAKKIHGMTSIEALWP